ncbi:MAG TPA: hypothetical protein VMA77_28745 [Solirubrobacteraceae bacterium]|nr:hypothetical protein [Solirubrobacteraceae bacterium]
MSATLTAGASLKEELGALVPVALRGLAAMQDERTGLFSHKTVVGPDGGLENRGVNRLYTGACVVGLLSSWAPLVEPHLAQVRRALDALLRDEERDPAVLATALWGAALSARPEAPRLARRLSALAKPGRLSSMELGLAVVALARWLRIGDRDDRAARDAARALAAELERRYLPRARVFAATGTQRLRNPALAGLTSFASQVYPVFGLCELAEATGVAPSRTVGAVCDFLVRSQGARGQWWWFYSTHTPKVIEGYPVYSVHQDAMAIMALLPATRVGAGEYLSAVTAGVPWVRGHNELGVPLIDPRAGLIYRSIQRPGGDADGLGGWSRRQRVAAYLAALSGRGRAAPESFEILRECRSYHLGWLLLAAAMAGAGVGAPAPER